jgi:conjugal transfer pilus assembly protein TraE
MNLGAFNRTWQSTNRSNAYLLISNVILASVAGLLVIDKVSQHERIVLTPPYIDKPMTVAWKSADGEYLKAFGLYFTTLTANVTPKNVRFVADQLSSIVSPAIYPAVQKKLLALANDPAFLNTGGSVRFEPSRVLFEAETSKVFVSGEMTTQTAAGKPEIVMLTYELVVNMRDGRPVVDAIDSYDGDTARTRAWVQLHKADLDAEKLKEKDL